MARNTRTSRLVKLIWTVKQSKTVKLLSELSDVNIRHRLQTNFLLHLSVVMHTYFLCKRGYYQHFRCTQFYFQIKRLRSVVLFSLCDSLMWSSGFLRLLVTGCIHLLVVSALISSLMLWPTGELLTSGLGTTGLDNQAKVLARLQPFWTSDCSSFLTRSTLLQQYRCVPVNVTNTNDVQNYENTTQVA